jgi:hypothetical protein
MTLSVPGPIQQDLGTPIKNTNLKESGLQRLASLIAWDTTSKSLT